MKVDASKLLKHIDIPEEFRRVAPDGTKVRYYLMELADHIPDVITLGRGDPDLNTPAHVIAAAQEAIRDGRADIPAPPAGLPELREAIAQKLRRGNGIPVNAEGVMVTNGSQEALYLTIHALINPGDEILVPDPRYTSYDYAIEQAGGRMVLLPTYPEDNFDLRPEVVASAITPKSKALLLITPGNPTAGVISPANLRAIASLAIEHNLIVISDEIYEQYVYPPAEHLSIASLPGMMERTVTINGFSKAYAMTGWRVGYVAACPAFIRLLLALKKAISGCTTTVSQYAALAAITGPQNCIDEYRAIYNRRRTIMLAGLRKIGLICSEPLGAFYIYANIAPLGIPALELCYLLLKEAHVLIFPGTAFGEKWTSWLRISFLQSEELLKEALNRIGQVLNRYR